MDISLNFYPIDTPPSSSKTDIQGLSLTATPAMNTEDIEELKRKGATIGVDLKDSNNSVILQDEDVLNYVNFEAIENMTAGEFGKIVNDSGVPKIGKVFGFSDIASVASLATGGGNNPSVYKIVKISDSKVAIYYDTIRTAGVTYYNTIKLIVGTLSGKTWTWGSEVTVCEGQLNNGGTAVSFINACLVTTDTIMSVLNESVTGNPVGSRNFTISYTSEISGNEVSNTYSEDWGWGQADGDGKDTAPTSCVQISDGKVVVTANVLTDTDFSAKCGTWNGTTNAWTIGTIFDINTTNNGGASWKLDTDRFFSIYNTTTVNIMTVSGTTISSVATDTLAGTNQHRFAVTGASAGVYTYNDGGVLKICSFTESAGAITEANTTTIDATLTANTALEIRIGTLDFYIAWDDQMTTIRLLAGTGFQFVTESQMDTDGIDLLSAVSKNRFIAVNMKGDYSVIQCITGDYDLADLLGILKTTVLAGGYAQLQTKGIINKSQAGLVVGVLYYLNPRAELTINSTVTVNGIAWTNKQVGTAVSTTNLLIKIN